MNVKLLWLLCLVGVGLRAESTPGITWCDLREGGAIARIRMNGVADTYVLWQKEQSHPIFRLSTRRERESVIKVYTEDGNFRTSLVVSQCPLLIVFDDSGYVLFIDTSPQWIVANSSLADETSFAQFFRRQRFVDIIEAVGKVRAGDKNTKR